MLPEKRSLGIFLALGLTPCPALAASWTLWADDSNNVPPGNFPQIAISTQRQIFLTRLFPQAGASGVVLRADLDDPAPQFVQMPGFPLPTPAPGKGYANVFCMTTNAQGEPIVGLSANGSSMNTEPMLMTWDEAGGKWFAPKINPPGEVCAHNMYILDRAPNGDIWAGCQWHGAYRSTDAGASFDYVDVSKLVGASTPGYYPTRASGAGDLGALYGLHIGPDDRVYFGTETGGVVYSTDRGKTFLPLDAAPNDPMSSMARATNSGNVGGLGVTPDGRILVQGADGVAPYPPPDGVHFYVFDPVAKTTTLATGFPDYFLGGQQVTQIVTMPSGQMFLHTNHMNVDPMTGTPTLGGIMTSDDGVSWTAFNTGIDEAFKLPNMNVWIDGNGQRLGRAFAVDGDDLYTVTENGKIYVLATDPQADTDGGTTDGTTTDGSTTDGGATTGSHATTGDPGTGPGSSDASGDPGTPTSGETGGTAGGAGDVTGSDEVTSGPGGDTGGAAADTTDTTGSSDAGGATGDASGCGCRSRGPADAGGATLLLAGAAAWARPRRRSGAARPR